MKTLRKFLSTLFCIGILLPAVAQSSKIAIKDITLYSSPYEKKAEHITILIKDGKIERTGSTQEVPIPEDYQIIDGQGKFATAGFWNSHVHLMEKKWEGAKDRPYEIEQHLKDMLTSRGVVYAFDLAELSFDNLNDIRRLIEDKTIAGPTIFTVGVPLTSNSPFYILPLKLPELHTVAEVREHIERQIKEGADGIKLWSASPVRGEVTYMDTSLIRVASQMTKSRGLPLFAHPTNNIGVKNAVETGVSILAHPSPTDLVNWSDTLIRTMIEKNVALIPTLKLCTWELKREKIYEPNHPLLLTAQNQLSSYFKAGGMILFGTDVGYIADYDPTDEYVLMEESGMRFPDILASLTTNPAGIFGYASSRGKVEAGYDADIVILQDDPATDITNLSKVLMSIHKGKIIYDQRVDGRADSGGHEKNTHKNEK